MSKVKIEGHGTGTGTFTVTTPSSNTDRTITLPDSTDTLAVNSDVTNKLPLAGGTMTGELVLPVEGLDMPVANTYITGGGHNVVQVDATMSYFYGGTGGVQFRTADNTSELVGIDNSGHIVAGNGVTLGNGQTYAAANTLDDYEEGTWTPSLQLAPSGVTMGTIHVATYTKIGNRVHLTLACNLNSSSSPAPNNDMRMTGFPFPFADSGDLFNATLHANYKETPQLFMNGGRYFYFQSTTVGGNNQSPIGGGLDSVSTLGLCMTYRTTS